MATNIQLSNLLDSGPLRDKIVGACLVVAENVRAEVPGTTARRAWAKSVIIDPQTVGGQMMAAYIAKSNALALASINGGTDGEMVTAITAFLDVMVGV